VIELRPGPGRNSARSIRSRFSIRSSSSMSASLATAADRSRLPPGRLAA
jgi:hypothetical protein